jgi:hypothetical protein
MRRFFCICIAIFLLMNGVVTTHAQSYFYNDKYFDSPLLFEVGGSIGAMNCLTDLGGRKGIGKKFIKDINLKNTNLSGSFYIDAFYKNKIAVRLEASFGQVSAADSVLKKVSASTFGRYERNLSFRSSITELALTLELHPFYIIHNYNEDETRIPPLISPYFLVGVGFLKFNPQAKVLNNWIDLQPLSTEGQGFKEYPDRQSYKLNTISFPVGVGMQYELSPIINLRAEFLYRFLNTDYLDDVSSNYIDPALYAKYFTGSKYENALLLNDRQPQLNANNIATPNGQRGNPKNNDAFFSFNVKMGLVLGRQRRK